MLFVFSATASPGRNLLGYAASMVLSPTAILSLPCMSLFLTAREQDFPAHRRVCEEHFRYRVKGCRATRGSDIREGRPERNAGSKSGREAGRREDREGDKAGKQRGRKTGRERKRGEERQGRKAEREE
eukprot:756949-Hanusia_phi.AAC.3